MDSFLLNDMDLSPFLNPGMLNEDSLGMARMTTLEGGMAEHPSGPSSPRSYSSSAGESTDVLTVTNRSTMDASAPAPYAYDSSAPAKFPSPPAFAPPPAPSQQLPYAPYVQQQQQANIMPPPAPRLQQHKPMPVQPQTARPAVAAAAAAATAAIKAGHSHHHSHSLHHSSPTSSQLDMSTVPLGKRRRGFEVDDDCSKRESKKAKEKARRDKMNDKFNELVSLLGMPEDNKADRVSILGETISLIRRIRAENTELRNERNESKAVNTKLMSCVQILLPSFGADCLKAEDFQEQQHLLMSHVAAMANNAQELASAPDGVYVNPNSVLPPVARSQPSELMGNNMNTDPHGLKVVYCPTLTVSVDEDVSPVA